MAPEEKEESEDSFGGRSSGHVRKIPRQPEAGAEAESEQKTAAGRADEAICWKPKRGNSFKAHHDLARRLNSAEDGEERLVASKTVAANGSGGERAGNSNAEGCESGEKEDC